MYPKILIIIPCYNEAERLEKQAFIDFVKCEPDFHFLFVNDGSKDQTEKIILDLESENLNFFAHSLSSNKGKAEAIRSGVNFASGNNLEFDFIGYIDADLAVPLSELILLRKQIIENHKLKFLMGVRLARLGANIQRNNTRHYMGRVFATVVSTMLHEPTYDTQCGAKLIHRDIARQLFADSFTSRWFFDVELIFRIKKYFPELLKNNQVLEVPLNVWIEKGDSRLKMIDFLKAPVELLSIKSRYSKSKSREQE
ncbi:MAG: glycosyltransferase [Crocinitomicaceae bacterium]